MDTQNFYDIAFNEGLCFYQLDMTCSFENREEIGCTNEFYNQGFLKDLVWDTYAEYRYKCRNCHYFKHDIGYYYGDKKFTDNFSEKEIFMIAVKNTEDLDNAIKLLPKHTKALWLSSMGSIDYSSIADLPKLETVFIDISKNIALWDMSKTPNLQVLELNVGTIVPDLSGLKNAKSLRHFGLITHISQINKSIIPSFNIFKAIPVLDSLTLSGITSTDNHIDDLIAIPNLKRLWISPNIFSVEEYAKFESLKFKISDEYGIFSFNEEENEYYPFGNGKHRIKSKNAKERFAKEYKSLMEKYS